MSCGSSICLRMTTITLWRGSPNDLRSCGFEAGETIINEGAPADRFTFVLEGELQFSRPSEPSLGVFTIGAGEPTGLLSFFPNEDFYGPELRHQADTLAVMHGSHLPELVCKAPRLAEKLVWEMTRTERASSHNYQSATARCWPWGNCPQGWRMSSIILHPPWFVRQRSFERSLVQRRNEAVSIRAQFFPETIQKTLQDLANITVSAAQNPPHWDDLERSDHEAELSEWLDQHRVDSGMASDLLLAGITSEVLEPLAKSYESHMLNKILTLLLSDFQMLALISEIEEASRRMSQLVQDVKSYSFMDTASVSEIDVAEGLRATLRMFQHQLKHGFTVKKAFAENLPKIRANGNELNQVWTNLIDNAVDAMEDLEGGSQSSGSKNHRRVSLDRG